MESYLPAITTVLGALIALAGVRLSARADDRRARDARLWDRRAELYVDALRFLQDLDRLRAEDLAEPAFTARMNDLDARMGAFGDDDTVAAFKRARLPEYDGTFSPPDWFERVVRERLTQQRALPQGLVLKALKYRLTQKRIVIPTTYSSTRHNPSYLVSCFGSVFTSGGAWNDLFGGLGPDEGLAAVIPAVDEDADRGDEVLY